MTDQVNCNRNKQTDQYERDRLVPNFRPQIDVRTKPTSERMVVTKTRDQTQHPTGEIQHTVYKSTAISIHQAENDDDYQQQIDRVNCHD